MTDKTQATAAPGKYWARLCALPKFSFILSAAGGVARAQDSCGNWVEASAVQQIVDDAESRIAELEAQAASKCLHRADAALEKPEAGRYVLAWTEGAKVPIRAMWAPQFFLEMAEDDAESGEYCEAKDQYFCPEGWYENNAHEETHWNVDRPVIAWMELPRRSPTLQAAPPAPAAVAVPIELQGVKEAVEQGSGFWRSCTGCHELNEGHDTGPVSKVFGCALGNGCSECGGIGAVWDDIDYGAMADAMAAPAQEHATQLAGQGQEDCPVLDDDWKRRMLDGRPLVRDEMGCGYHPALPTLDEGMNPKQFCEALGIQLAGSMADGEMNMDTYDAMVEATDYNVWTPEAPAGDGWVLVAIFDTEDGPAAWWIRQAAPEQPARKNRKAAPAQVQEDARDAELFRAMANAAITEDAVFGECLERLGGDCKTIDDIRAVFDAARAAQGGAA